MRNNFILGIILLLLLTNSWMIFTFQFPFYLLDLVIIGVSVMIMTMLHGRFVFLYLVIAILSYGAFLTIYTYFYNDILVNQLLLIYDHLLVTAFLLLYWVVINFVKNINYENESLKKQLKLLEKTNKNTGVLTVHEFIYEATGILNSVKRHSEAWFIRLDITYENKYTQKNMQEYMERIVLTSVRERFDIVTSTNNKIFFILKDTNDQGVNIVLDRIKEKVKRDFNFLHVPYEVSSERFISEAILSQIEGGIQ